MNNQQLQLVNFGQAALLKKAGFDWPTIHLFYYRGQGNVEGNSVITPEDHNGYHPNFYSRPAVSLALKWVRDVKKYVGVVKMRMEVEENSYEYEIFSNGWKIWTESQNFTTHESAESALLDELLAELSKEE